MVELSRQKRGSAEWLFLRGGQQYLDLIEIARLNERVGPRGWRMLKVDDMLGAGYGGAQKGGRLPKQKNHKVLIRIGERVLTTLYCNGSSTLDSAPGWETGRRQLGVTGKEAMVIEWWRDIAGWIGLGGETLLTYRIRAKGLRIYNISIIDFLGRKKNGSERKNSGTNCCAPGLRW